MNEGVNEGVDGEIDEGVNAETGPREQVAMAKAAGSLLIISELNCVRQVDF